jgi:hypothetical protein
MKKTMMGRNDRKRARLDLTQSVHAIEPVQSPTLTIIPNDGAAKTDVRLQGPPRQAPGSFFCPLAKEIMFDPVLDANGKSYERKFLLRWLKDNRNNRDQFILPNIALRKAIHEHMGSQWVSKKVLECFAFKNGTDSSTSQKVTMFASPLRAKIASYLWSATSKLELNLQLNDEGCCVFKSKGITIILDVPERNGIFCFYTKNLILVDLEDSQRNQVFQKALELNFLQGTHTSVFLIHFLARKLFFLTMHFSLHLQNSCHSRWLPFRS